MSEFRLREFRHIQTDDDRLRLAEPPTRRRARDSQVRRHSHVPAALDKIPKPVVIALLRAGDGWHGNDHRRFCHTALNSSWGDYAGVTTTRAAKSRMSVGTAPWEATMAVFILV